MITELQTADGNVLAGACRCQPIESLSTIRDLTFRTSVPSECLLSSCGELLILWGSLRRSGRLRWESSIRTLTFHEATDASVSHPAGLPSTVKDAPRSDDPQAQPVRDCQEVRLSHLLHPHPPHHPASHSSQGRYHRLSAAGKRFQWQS